MKRFRWDKKYLYWGVTAFLVIACSILFYLIVSNLSWLGAALQKLGKILSPFIWGLVIAYLLFPLMRIYQRGLFQPLANLLYRKAKNGEKRSARFARGFSVFLAEVTMLVLVGGLVWLVAPQIYESIESLIVNSERYVGKADEWIDRLFIDYPQIEKAVSGMYGDISEGILSWAANNLLPEMKGILTNLSSGVYSFAKGIYNVIIGIIVSVYVLSSKETFGAHSKKLLYSVFSLEASQKILESIQFINKVFMGFLSGKILDSVIIGILCYIGCRILEIEYAVLVSFLVGVTNIIPFFGPLFGMIPSAMIIFMESPFHAVVFLFFVILLQQFDGNVLGPKILGSRVGINGFWVMFSIILGAGLFGFEGMLLGVPVFVVIYTFIKNMVRKKLIRSGLPSDTEEFLKMDHIDPATGEPVAPEKEKRQPGRKRGSRKRKEPAEVAGSDADAKSKEDQR